MLQNLLNLFLFSVFLGKSFWQMLPSYFQSISILLICWFNQQILTPTFSFFLSSFFSHFFKTLPSACYICNWSVFRNASDLIMKVSRLLTCFFLNHSDVYLYVYICVQLLLFLILYYYSFIWLHWKQLLNPFNFVISYGPRNIMKIFLN